MKQSMKNRAWFALTVIVAAMFCWRVETENQRRWKVLQHIQSDLDQLAGSSFVHDRLMVQKLDEVYAQVSGTMTKPELYRALHEQGIRVPIRTLLTESAGVPEPAGER